jgi:hypothetical protein
MASKLTTLAQQKTAAQLQTLTQESIKWLMQKISELKKTSNLASSINREQYRQTSKFILGGLYYFYYDPKTKDEIPYYDRFPLVLVLERYPDGFLGLNLHYLPLKYRIAFLDKLLDYAAYTPDDEIKRIKITYDILNMSKRMQEFKPCVKRYLYPHVKSKMLAVQPNEWDIAIFLPIQQFKKARANKVWEESIKQIRNS